jgi:anthranilate synthase component 2
MQCINEAFGGRTVRAPLPMHGKTCLVRHEGDGVFQGTPSPFSVARYHSLMVEFDDSELRVNARSDDGVPMGMRHPEYPLHGVQFHPESFLTEHGFTLIENFLEEGPLAVRRDFTGWKPKNGNGLMPAGVGAPPADEPVFSNGAYG